MQYYKQNCNSKCATMHTQHIERCMHSPHGAVTYNTIAYGLAALDVDTELHKRVTLCNIQ
jgi:hypothetical protein